jgi:hypothetical protein
VKLSAPVEKAILSALSERDETAAICRDSEGEAEPDPELRDTESVPLAERVEAFFEREVRPHVSDAWIDTDRRDPRDGQVGLVGYEINFNRYFYRYTPPRPLEEIEGEIRVIEQDILRMLAEVTGGPVENVGTCADSRLFCRKSAIDVGTCVMRRSVPFRRTAVLTRDAWTPRGWGLFRPRDVPLGCSASPAARRRGHGREARAVSIGWLRSNRTSSTIGMVATAAPDAIVCLLGPHIYEIGTQSPHQVWLAIDRGPHSGGAFRSACPVLRTDADLRRRHSVYAGGQGPPHESGTHRRGLFPVPEQDRARRGHGGAPRRGALAQGHDQRDRPGGGGVPHQDGHRPLPGGAVGMSARETDGRAESIRQRLRNELRSRGEDVTLGLSRYAVERFLYRLGRSSHREHVVLKGATLFAIWGTAYRPTRDVDFTGYGGSEPEDVIAAFGEISTPPTT